ncbi:MAG TPA: hypothetical protein VGL10_01755 [Gammaproteobacteria bacterium]
MKIIQLPSLSLAAMLIVFAAILLVYTGIGHAAENGVPDITMSVLESEDDAEQRTFEIQLPDKAALSQEEGSAPGLDTANQARDHGREFGQEQAERARNRDKPHKREKKPKKPKPH